MGCSMGKITLLCCLLLVVAATCQEDEGSGVSGLVLVELEETPDEVEIMNEVDNGHISVEEGDEGEEEIDMPSLELGATDDGTMTEEEVTENDQDMVNVKTFLGVVSGTQEETEAGTTYFKFEGIPYAEPPVGNLRFLPPRPIGKREKIVATQPGQVCPQVLVFGEDKGFFRGDEDCLYLNIYTPSISHATNPLSLKPVMLWIHGGGFMVGHDNEYGDFSHFIDKDVVIVSINYRLGPLGFMTFGNSLVSGNMGLKDQNMAIRWTRNNIGYFGGNPNKITIFGESAGGISVHAQLLSPFNFGLLAGAIAQSGNLLSKNLPTFGQKEERSAIKLAETLQCSSDRLDEEMLKCLQEIPVEGLMFNSLSTMAEPTPVTREEILSKTYFEWWPVIDYYANDPFLPIPALEAMRNGIYNQIPFMSGTCKNEALIFGYDLEKLEELSPNWDLLGPTKLSISPGLNISDITKEDVLLANIIKKYYTGEDYSQENKQNIMNMFTDSFFLSPDQVSVSLMSKYNVPIFNYMLTYRGTNTYARLFGDDGDFGVSHVDDLIYLFKNPAFTLTTEDELTLSDHMVTFWTNFAKYGNPTPFKIDGIPNWDFVSPYKKNYMDLKPQPELKQNAAEERMMFWERLIWGKRENQIERKKTWK